MMQGCLMVEALTGCPALGHVSHEDSLWSSTQMKAEVIHNGSLHVEAGGYSISALQSL